jgi:endonuclease/exonuclease/phosphatase family metal-dependent hydrolase
MHVRVWSTPHTRQVMWELLKRLKSISGPPWLLIGDFNEALWSFEHMSSCRRPENQMLQFRDTLHFCNVFDQGFLGVHWTFDNKQSGDQNVWVRLDRAVASSSWSDWFPDAKVHHLFTGRSDHLPIFLELQQEDGLRMHGRIACYEIMWERESSLSDEI